MSTSRRPTPAVPNLNPAPRRPTPAPRNLKPAGLHPTPAPRSPDPARLFRLLGLFILLPLLPGLVAPAPLAAQAVDPDEWLEVEVATVGVDLATGAPMALVHEGWEELLPIWIGNVEAEAILRVLQAQPFARPLTHDLMASILSTMEVELAEVRIHDMREGTYIGSLHLREAGGDELREVDARPSDGLALAVRTGARVRVARRLLSGVPEVDFVSTERQRTIARVRSVTVAEPGSEDRRTYALPDESAGVVVLHLGVGMANRGLQPGDLITALNGSSVTSALEFIHALGRVPDASAVSVEVIRDGEVLEVQIPARRGPGRVG